MKKLLFIVSFIFSFSLFAQSADEREIYSLIINSFTEKDIQINNKLFRVSYEDGLGEKEEYDIFMKRFLFLKKSTYKDFIKNNKEIRTINNDFNSDKNITIIDSNNNERIVFSSFGFDVSKTQALVQYKKSEIFVMLFEKKDGKWFLKEEKKLMDLLNNSF